MVQVLLEAANIHLFGIRIALSGKKKNGYLHNLFCILLSPFTYIKYLLVTFFPGIVHVLGMHTHMY